MIEGLDRASKILDLFSSDIPEWTVTTVHRALGIPKTTAWEYLQALLKLGFLRRAGKRSYRLGWRSFQLGLRARATSEIAGPARRAIEELSATIQEPVHLASRYKSEVVILEKATPPSGVRLGLTRVGARLPAHCTALGKVLLASLTSSELAPLTTDLPAASMTAKSITDTASLDTALAHIRDTGYAVDAEETLEGLCCVAAPVTNAHGDVTWAISISFVEHKMEEKLEHYANIIQELAQRLSLVTSSQRR